MNTLAACRAFVEFQPPRVIAAQLRKDQSICQANAGFPSLIVHCLPPTSSSASNAIAHALSSDDPDPQNSGVHIPLIVSKFRLAGIVQCIKSYLSDMRRQDIIPDDSGTPNPIPPQLIPSDEEFNAALKVLQYLQLPYALNIAGSTQLTDVVAVVEKQLYLGQDVRHAQLNILSSASNRKRQRWEGHRKILPLRRCYICRFFLTSAHSLYPSLCVPCGNFNTASLALSLPPQFDMSSKTALVTGARINLGYHVVLRLLRSGCSVIATTRYPHDAETRYQTETDYATWKDRLRIVGADFRSAKDVFALIDIARDCLRIWGSEKLDVLINNAAQTLTDQPNVEIERKERECILKSQGVGHLVTGSYEPRLRGGVATIEYQTSTYHSTAHRQAESQESSVLQIRPDKSSWTQRLQEIPYEDIITAHSINTFVPLILVRELLPIMSASSPPSAAPPSRILKPLAYIVNVSSREGIPESLPEHSSKAGRHVHTNMSKAALNMLTETEAAEAWKKARVAINSVDPGYMSADPEWMESIGRDGQNCPIGWEDGAARVLWPIAMGENGSRIWGRFIKHFQVFEVIR